MKALKALVLLALLAPSVAMASDDGMTRSQKSIAITLHSLDVCLQSAKGSVFDCASDRLEHIADRLWESETYSYNFLDLFLIDGKDRREVARDLYSASGYVGTMQYKFDPEVLKNVLKAY